ncbi:unnamed protein product [Orchesella dallaii]|uniref:EB domain-containing protein n=1 Tax=Orchesella dallaii TaxID=48710 RepID=A0ABP1QBB9_9HEXA
MEPKSVESKDGHSYYFNYQHYIDGLYNIGPKVPKQFAEGTEGTNQAVFNENCSPTVKCHNPDNLVCSSPDGTGNCVCKEGYVYVHQAETCLVIPKSDQDPCAHDIQCHEGKWGKVSRCNKDARCECYDYLSYGSQETVLVDGVCYIKKSVGAPCSTNEECNPIPGEAYCKPGDRYLVGGIQCTIINGEIQCLGGTCQCKDTHLWFKPLSECLLLASKPGDACKVNEQCMMYLGRYSRCDTSSGTCKCGPPRSNEADIPDSFFYEPLQKCFVKKTYNSPCEEKDECVASLGPDVLCGKSEDYPETNTCHCPSGRVCRNQNNAFRVVPSSDSWTISVAGVGMKLAMNGVGVGLTIDLQELCRSVGVENYNGGK